MKTAIVVHPSFDTIWPFAADRLHQLLKPMVDVSFVRQDEGTDASLAEVIVDPSTVRRLISLGVPLTEADLDALPVLEEAFVTNGYAQNDVVDLLASRGIRHLSHRSEGFWGQSVSEFALGLTIAALRRIPQTHHAILSRLDDWDYPLQQFGDDPAFTNGTVEGKRIRIVGAGNIASRYASFVNMLGADVATWDPYASEPAFHRSGARKEWHLDKLVVDAEIFVPMVPLMPSTEGLVTAEHIDALPTGCLVILATRAGICDMEALRRRVLADELSLAADVFDIEPLALDDPLLGRHNVVHTPHNAGRTKESNFRWAELLVEQFGEYDRSLVEPRPVIPAIRQRVS
jgi:phosphoglycerate dehydrogenase-like enzyme